MAAGEDHSYNQEGKKRKRGRKEMSKHGGSHRDNLAKNSGNRLDETVRTQRSSKHQKAAVPKTSFVRLIQKPLNILQRCVIEGSEIDLEERSVICGNALEEARGKEVELVTDYIISHTLQTLLEGCSVEHLSGFLRSSAKDFSHIATDRSGSHVAETARKALGMHLQDIDTHSLIEETLSTIFKAVLKLLAGQDELLLHIIQILLGTEKVTEGNLIEMMVGQKLLSLMEETAFSHLMEVIFAKRPDQWKLGQTSKQSPYKEFYAAFGPSESKASEKKSFLAEPYHKSKPEKLKEMRKEIDTCLSRVTPTPSSHFLSLKHQKLS